MVVHSPEEIAAIGVVEQIKTLLLAVVDLSIPIISAYKERDHSKRNRGGLTRGEPGIAKLAMNIPRALL
jgi:hypothetical protein